MRTLTVLAMLMLALSVCANLAAASGTSSGEVIAKVGNETITRTMLDHIIDTIPEENRAPFLTPDGRKKILTEVIEFFLFAQAAKTKGIADEPAIKTRLDYTQKEYLAREFFKREFAKQSPVTDEEAQAYYKAHLSEFKPQEELKARHILVKTESEANKIEEKLKAGEDFEALAKKYSIDPAGKEGGKFQTPDGRDWLTKGMFEQSFAHQLFLIPKGSFGKPTKTQFGWHILKVDDRRQPETPAFVQVRSMIINRLQEQKANTLKESLSNELKKTIPVEMK
ncbi:MAG: peptidyl-prolyl cis-trans isomerase [Thermodesulfobacteriota bacterium]